MRSCSFLWRASFAVLLAGSSLASAQSVPSALRPGIQVRLATEGPGGAVRIALDQSSGFLYYLTLSGGVYRLAPPFVGEFPQLVHTSADHGLGASVQGMTIAPNGTMFLVGNIVTGAENSGIIVRGRPDQSGGRHWETVATTEPYPRSNTPFDHNFNGIVLSPDGRFVFVNSGSRTDHGEVQDHGGQFPGLREVPLTSAIFRIPADSTDLVLRNDEGYLLEEGYLFAEGVRNSFSLAFDAAGVLFGTENAGDRDDSEELNWIQEGRHYGFPWRMGLADTPQQFPDYDPAPDLLLNPAAFAVQNGFFHNDTTYPPPPDDVIFTQPIRNLGPDADLYRDEEDGKIKKADGRPFATFSAHRSPLGLVFDVEKVFPAGYAGGGFVLSWTGSDSPLMAPFGDEGEDLLHLDLQRDGESYVARVRRLVRGFRSPIDAAIVGDRIYVLEFGDPARIWEVSIDSPLSAEAEIPHADFSIELFPNPVSHSAHATVRTDRTQRIEIDVYTLLGKHIARIYEGLLEGGLPHTLRLEMTDFAAGMYLLRIRGERFTFVKKVIAVPER